MKATETEKIYMAAKLGLESVDGEISSLEDRSEKLTEKFSAGQMPRSLPIRYPAT